jgi:cytochrome c-type biogenesis protein CcmH/NrfF
VCGFWQPLHAEVAEMANQGMTAEEIIDAYVAKHGTQFLMAPPPHGFNLAGYLVPSILISLVGATLVFVLRRRVNMTSAVSTGSGSSAGLSDSEHARIVAELEKLGS